ncbi:hypothetical protein JCM10914A_30110 [Paenibacillus sp. JCM 10914]|uniref:CAP domain-containing protein n=1 Tax=Paenibacillus sp. JCM 10914 TaxID=1236974 RepID=UPI0003CC4D8D|nr:CAP domain-containing protein [Paenibacillus sp. JCM 10914]GAE07145.1 hypothetical protein JCM10914_3357 [Paenibacillus sp. JCM 10914]
MHYLDHTRCKPAYLTKHPMQRVCRILLLGLLTAILYAFLLQWGVQSAYASPSERFELPSYTQDQLDALVYLNTIRIKAGLPAVSMNAQITKAAELHAHYFNNNHIAPNLGAHHEQAGLPGFRGTTVKERLAAAGYVSPSPYGYGYGEVMHFRQKNSMDAMNGWLDTAYHRQLILSPRYQEIGIALVNGTAVVNLAGSGTSAIDGGLALYPYDGMKNVGIGFYGFENPNPLLQFNAAQSGYIISATATGSIQWHQAKMTDKNGSGVPFFAEVSRDTLFLYPKEILQYDHCYTVSIDYQLDGSDEKRNRTWSFTTRAEGINVNPSLTYSKMLRNPSVMSFYKRAMYPLKGPGVRHHRVIYQAPS